MAASGLWWPLPYGGYPWTLDLTSWWLLAFLHAYALLLREPFRHAAVLTKQPLRNGSGPPRATTCRHGSPLSCRRCATRNELHTKTDQRFMSFYIAACNDVACHTASSVICNGRAKGISANTTHGVALISQNGITMRSKGLPGAHDDMQRLHARHAQHTVTQYTTVAVEMH